LPAQGYNGFAEFQRPAKHFAASVANRPQKNYRTEATAYALLEADDTGSGRLQENPRQFALSKSTRALARLSRRANRPARWRVM